MPDIITFFSGSQRRFISCISLTPPAKIAYSSSERAVDAIKFPHHVGVGIQDMLNTRWSLDCSLERVEGPRG